MKDLSGLYNRSYYHGDGYDNYTLQKLGRGFLHKIRLVKKFAQEGRLLDVGCALGYFVHYALEEGFDAYGIDFSEYAIQEARKLVDGRVICSNMEKDIPFENGSFDIVTAWDVLEHLRYPDLFLKRISRMLEKNGLLFITTLNYNSLLSKLMKERWQFISPGYHQTHTITASDLRHWLDSAGFQTIRLHTFGLLLKNFSTNIPSSAMREMAELAEKMLRSQIQLMLRLLRPLNLGDTILCIAKRFEVST